MEWLPWAFCLLNFVACAALVWVTRRDVSNSIEAIGRRYDEALKSAEEQYKTKSAAEAERFLAEMTLLRAHNTEMSRIVGGIKIAKARNVKPVAKVDGWQNPPPFAVNGAEPARMTLQSDGPDD